MYSNKNSQKQQQISESELKKLKLELEKEGEERVKKINTTTDENKMIDELVKIMEDGETEFVKKTGRHMTYSEIREMYG